MCAHTLRSNKQYVFAGLNVVNRGAFDAHCLLGQLCVIMRQRFRKENHQLSCLNVGAGNNDLFWDLVIRLITMDCSWTHFFPFFLYFGIPQKQDINVLMTINLY